MTLHHIVNSSVKYLINFYLIFQPTINPISAAAAVAAAAAAGSAADRGASVVTMSGVVGVA